jgi:hypothetical protein
MTRQAAHVRTNCVLYLKARLGLVIYVAHILKFGVTLKHYYQAAPIVGLI